MILKEGVILYHGSFENVSKPDLSKCKTGKDFGRGFYLTTDKNQAKAFVRTTIRKKILSKEIPADVKAGYVSSFVFHSSSELNVFEFRKADKNWLHCVCAHRIQGKFPEVFSDYIKYDVIIGKIANDKTNPVITLYLAGGFGETGSKNADRMACRLLLPEVLTDQLCFRTERALACLEYKNSEVISYGK